MWELAQPIASSSNRFHHTQRSGRVISRDVLKGGDEVAPGGRRPFYRTQD